MTMRIRAAAALLAAAVAGAACDEDDTGVTPPETRSFEVTVENVSPSYDFPASGAFDTPRDADAPGPLFPGGIYEVSFHAAPGHALSFATMFVQSNDLFFADDGEGIALFERGRPIAGDVTDQLLLWDAGTEEDAAPGTGPYQVLAQPGPDSGPDEGEDVTLASETGDGFDLPPVADVVRVTVTPIG